MPISQGTVGPCAVEDPVHVRNHRAREPGDPAPVCNERRECRPHREVQGRTPMTNGRGKSDNLVVPEKPPNKAERSVEEAMEGRRLAKGNSIERNAPRTQSRTR